MKLNKISYYLSWSSQLILSMIVIPGIIIYNMLFSYIWILVMGLTTLNVFNIFKQHKKLTKN